MTEDRYRCFLSSVLSLLSSDLVGLVGFEPTTPRLSSVCSNQLSYRPAHQRTEDGRLKTEFVACATLPFLSSVLSLLSSVPQTVDKLWTLHPP
jgi:hypothetical protein